MLRQSSSGEPEESQIAVMLSSIDIDDKSYTNQEEYKLTLCHRKFRWKKPSFHDLLNSIHKKHHLILILPISSQVSKAQPVIMDNLNSASNGGVETGSIASTSLKLPYPERKRKGSGQTLIKEAKKLRITDGPPLRKHMMAFRVIELDSNSAALVEETISDFLSDPVAEGFDITLESTSIFAEDLFAYLAQPRRELKGEASKEASVNTMDYSEFLNFCYHVALFIKGMGNGKFSPAARKERLALKDKIHRKYWDRVFKEPRWQCCKCGNRNNLKLDRCEGRGCERHERCAACVAIPAN